MKNLKNTGAFITREAMISGGMACHEIIVNLNGQKAILSQFHNFSGKLNTPKSLMHRALSYLEK